MPRQLGTGGERHQLHRRGDVVSPMDDQEERRAVIAEAYDLVEQLADFTVERRGPQHIDALDNWRRQRPAPQPRKKKKMMETRQQDWSAWNAWCDARVTAALERAAKLTTGRRSSTARSHGAIYQRAQREQLRREFSEQIAELEARVDHHTCRAPGDQQQP